MEKWSDLPTQIAVRAIITNNKGAVLLTRRPQNDYEGDKWCLAGGKPKEDEDIGSAILREVVEEIGITPILIYYAEIENPNTESGVRWRTHYFIGETDKLPSQLQNEEVSEVGFFSQDDIQRMDSIAFDHKDVIARFFVDSSPKRE